MSHVLDLAIQLMQAESTSNSERPALECAEALLQGRGWRVMRIPVSKGRWNVYATKLEAPRVTLSTHLDTVPPYIPPRVEGSRLWGRGACDAKGLKTENATRRAVSPTRSGRSCPACRRP